jgi:hypothetical protein
MGVFQEVFAPAAFDANALIQTGAFSGDDGLGDGRGGGLVVGRSYGDGLGAAASCDGCGGAFVRGGSGFGDGFGDGEGNCS